MLLGVSGSVAAIKVPIIAKLLSEFCEVIVIATDASRKLLHVEQLESMHLPVKGAPTHWLIDSENGSMKAMQKHHLRVLHTWNSRQQLFWELQHL